MGNILDGKKVAEKVNTLTRSRAREFLVKGGKAPKLGTVLVGDDPASATYIRMKHKACQEAGIDSVHHSLMADATQKEVEQVVLDLVKDDSVDGILVQLPLPEHLNTETILLQIPPEKDVDGFHPQNIGAVASGAKGIAPCTPAGVIRMLDEYEVQIEGAEVVVVGRSRVVGLPMALMLLHRDATVTVTHLATRDLKKHTRQADILVVAAGKPALISGADVKPGAVVIDVGTTRTKEGLRGDVDFESVSKVASLISPVPGGVGPMTIAMLLKATVDLAYLRLAQG